MANGVTKKLLQQCREALLGGVPILYIKTESSILIRDMVEDQEEPLVVPINGVTKDSYSHRPIADLIKDGADYRKRAFNIKIGELPKAQPQMLYPFLWSYRMPSEPNALAEIFAKLEQYVLDHEDPGYPAYDVLQSSAVILYSSAVMISPMLRPYVEVIEVPFPDESEIRNILIAESGADPILMKDKPYLDSLCTRFQGFSTEEIISVMHKIMAFVPLDDKKRVKEQIFSRKKQKLEGGMLELVSDEGSIGGMNQYRKWLQEQLGPIKEANTYKRETGTLPPKGVLLCGIPGCGKSEAAKFTAAQLELPLLKMDVGSLMDKWQGNSEQKMRDALSLAEAMAPCVLWIDELEKGFSAAGGSSDNGSFKRMFGYMLGWMQDVKVPCFIFATANNIGGLPKEFFRSGRFDALYAVYLPTAAECVSIFRTSMDRAEKTIAKTRGIEEKDVVLFAAECFSEDLLRGIVNSKLVRPDGKPRIVIGSDIQKVVNIALRGLLGEETISETMWRKALVQALEDCAVYGDGEENIDSIAVSYCRMLRKNFVPTSDEVLFDSKDYVVSNLEEYERLERQRNSEQNEKTQAKLQNQLRQHEILQAKRDVYLHDDYDAAVYRYLLERINRVAPKVERYEREVLIRQ